MASESMGITEALAHVETFIGGTPAAALGDFLTVLRRAEIKGTAEYFGEYPERWKLVREGRHQFELPPSFWEYAEIGNKGPDTATRRRNHQYAFGVHVPRDAVLRIWPT